MFKLTSQLSFTYKVWIACCNLLSLLCALFKGILSICKRYMFREEKVPRRLSLTRLNSQWLSIVNLFSLSQSRVTLMSRWHSNLLGLNVWPRAHKINLNNLTNLARKLSLLHYFYLFFRLLVHPFQWMITNETPTFLNFKSGYDR